MNAGKMKELLRYLKRCLTQSLLKLGREELHQRIPMQSHPRLREALKYIGPKKSPRHFPKIMWLVIWELMKTQTKLNKLEREMDKKMHKITKKMEMAEKDVKIGKTKQAVKVLKGAEKKNEKLVKIDRDVRDPMIKKCKKEMKKGK